MKTARSPKVLSSLHREERSLLTDIHRSGTDIALSDAGEDAAELLSALEVYGLADAEGVLTPSGTRVARHLVGEE